MIFQSDYMLNKLATLAAGLLALTAVTCLAGSSPEARVLPRSGMVRQVQSLQASATNRVLSFSLKPTVTAPARAQGSAGIKSSVMSIHLSAVEPGRYEVRAIRRSDGGSEKLGGFSIVDATLSPSRQANENKKEASAHPESVSLETDASVALPPRINVEDISRVQIVGRDGNVVLDSGEK